MGTRGVYGYYKDNKFKVSYNHLDSYPIGLGENIKNYILKYSIRELNEHFDKIELVKENTYPIPEQIEKLKKFIDIAGETTDYWYDILRDCRGNLEKNVEAGFMTDSFYFLKDSLFCEWAYIINLDENMLEVYKGFQKERPKGRFKDYKPDNSGYYSVGLLIKLPLENINFDPLYVLLKMKENK